MLFRAQWCKQPSLQIETCVLLSQNRWRLVYIFLALCHMKKMNNYSLQASVQTMFLPLWLLSFRPTGIQCVALGTSSWSLLALLVLALLLVVVSLFVEILAVLVTVLEAEGVQTILVDDAQPSEQSGSHALGSVLKSACPLLFCMAFFVFLTFSVWFDLQEAHAGNTECFQAHYTSGLEWIVLHSHTTHQSNLCLDHVLSTHYC